MKTRLLEGAAFSVPWVNDPSLIRYPSVPKVGSGTAPDIRLKEMRSVQEAHKSYTWAVRYSELQSPSILH